MSRLGVLVSGAVPVTEAPSRPAARAEEVTDELNREPMDSSHGSAMATPRPRSKVLREGLRLLISLVLSSTQKERLAIADRDDDVRKLIIRGDRCGCYLINCRP